MKMKEFFDNNPESIPYLERLEEEWKLHGKIIIACDFDDTISPWKLKGFDPKRTVEVLKIAKETGAYIVIFTACNPERYDEIRKYCSDSGLEIDAINETPIDLPYGKNGKIYANIFIDDRAGLNEALNILEMAMYRIRGSRHKTLDF
jgi:thiol-disulfide isomerase/thioredoxin